MSLEAIAALLGHASLSMTMTYARIADRTVAEEYFAVTEHLDAIYTPEPAPSWSSSGTCSPTPLRPLLRPRIPLPRPPIDIERRMHNHIAQLTALGYRGFFMCGSRVAIWSIPGLVRGCDGRDRRTPVVLKG